MKSFIILGLVLIICIQGQFLRDLQANDGEAAASANQSYQVPALANETFNLTGNWTLWNSNCTVAAGATACVPVIQASINPANASQLTIVMIYPNNTACLANSGQTITAYEVMYNGMWDDTNATSPLFGTMGLYRLNNNTEIIWLNDVNNPNGGMCFEEWGNGLSTVTNATANITVNWEGAWLATEFTPTFDGAPCCVPVVPVLVHQDNFTETITYTWWAPQCPTCGTLADMVTVSNVSIAGGFNAALDNVTGTELFIYLINPNTIVALTAYCSIQYTYVTPTGCPAVNATNSTNP